LSLANSGVPGVTALGDKMLSIAERQNAALANNPMGQDPAQRAANAAAERQATIDRINATDFSGMDRQSFGNPAKSTDFGTDPEPGWGSSDRSSDPGPGDSGPDRSAGDPDHGDPGDSGPDRSAGDPSGPGWAQGGIAALADGGLGSLGGYSDGGRLLRGPGDGVSDSIPATIGQHQPARLADGEFVVPARIVSELGNGSTEAGARQLYAMMDRIQKGRRKTVGKNKVAANTRAAKHLPA
jgi:hypothetical protein